jgi:hypothetical protein
MNEDRITAFLRRRAEYCRRLAMMQRDPSIAQELRALARRYETSIEAGVPLGAAPELSLRG